MRKINKDLNDLPDIFFDERTLAQWEEIAKNKPDLIDDNIYKGSYRDSEGKSQSHVRDKLNDLYFSKCAYCETLCKAEIEHYRPKKRITGTPHEGYYWLCYEWSNLVPSCRYCNTEGGKGNQFPILGIRVEGPTFNNGKLDKSQCIASLAPLASELPLLLHPEIDEPEDHLEFCWDDQKEGIRIREKGNSQRGLNTIKICNLNRQDLRIERLKTVIDEFKQQIDLTFRMAEAEIIESSQLPRALKILFEGLRQNTQKLKLPHTLLRAYVISSPAAFEEIMGPYLEDANQKVLVLEAFKKFCNGNL
jgi:uncharacterized protein (TIGR02646 family)